MSLAVNDFSGRPRVEPSIDARFRVVGAARSAIVNPFVVTFLGRFNAGTVDAVFEHTTLGDWQDEFDPERLTDTPAKLAAAAFAPSFGGTPGAPRIRSVRVGDGDNVPTKATLALEDSGASTVATLSSIDRGTHVNRLRARVSAGTSTGRKIQVGYKERSDWIRTGDNLGNLFDVQYTGNASTATLTIAKTGDLATTLTLALAGDETDGSIGHVLDLTLADFDTVKKVADYINSQVGYSATLAATDLNLSTCPSYEMDAAAAEDINAGSSPPATYTVTAAIGAVVQWVNANCSRVGPIPGVTAARQAAAVNVPAVTAGWAKLAGGTWPAVALSDYNAALDVLEREETSAGLLIVDTADATIRQAVVDWMDEELTRGRKWRAVFGVAAGTTDIAARAAAASVGRETVAMWQQRVVEPGTAATLDPLFAAAMFAGLTGGMNAIGDVKSLVLTNKRLRAAGVAQADKKGLAARETSLDSGLNQLREEAGQVLISLAVSTYQGAETFYRRWAETVAIDWIRDAVISAIVAANLGVAWATNEYVQSVKSTVRGVLEAFRVAGVITAGADPDTGDAVAAYSPPVVTVLDGATTVTFGVGIAGETDHVRIDATVRRVALSSEA